MASRWANDEADAAENARRKKEKEEKKRAKLLKQQAAVETSAQDTEWRPSKRRKLSPSSAEKENDAAQPSSEGKKLLRFEGGGWGPCRHLNAFETLNQIDEGSFGWVSRAKEKKTGEVVALKKIKMESPDDGFPITALREVAILQRVRHENIVELKEVVSGESFDEVILVMKFVEHDLNTLQDDMPEPFLASEIKTLLRQLASAVDYLHTNHIMHRDLKTSNILLNNRGILKVADFGMARYTPPSTPNAPLTRVVVTLWYRAPEILLGSPTYDTSLDIWSLGCIFGELLLNTALLQGEKEVEQLSLIFALCGLPSEKTWPGFYRLPYAKTLNLPRDPASKIAGSESDIIRNKFPALTDSGVDLLSSLLSLNPENRPSAKQVLNHPYFAENPKPKPPEMFPTFPSKAGQERRRKLTPDAPKRGEKDGMEDEKEIDLRVIFAEREGEAK